MPADTPPLFLTPAAAFCRARLPAGALPARLARPELAVLDEAALREIVDVGRGHGLRLHRYKRTMGLPRVRRALGMLRGLQPAELLDVGSGRGAFLWPLLEAFPNLPVTSIDILPHRLEQLRAVRDGGLSRLAVEDMDLGSLSFPDGAFDGVTLLEVLEHVPDTERALAETLRVARRFALLSVPSKPDDNPEHIHLFDAAGLTQRLRAAGARRVSIDHVPGHILALALEA